MEDAQIIDLFLARSEEAIRQLDRKYGPVCRRLAKNILPSESDREECVSDAYLAAWNAIPPERPEALGPWLFRVVRNRAFRRCRENTAQKRNSFYDAALDELAEALPAPGTVEDALAAKELSALLDRFLAGLDPVNRVLFLRRYWYGDRVEDIAADMGLRPGTASVRLHRVRQKLRDYLIKEGYYL